MYNSSDRNPVTGASSSTASSEAKRNTETFNEAFEHKEDSAQQRSRHLAFMKFISELHEKGKNGSKHQPKNTGCASKNFL